MSREPDNTLPYPIASTIPAEPPPAPQPGNPPYPVEAGIPDFTQETPRREDPNEWQKRLEKYDTVLIDDLGSMKPHWSEVAALIQAIAGICVQRDRNGIDVYFVNHRPRTGRFPLGFKNIGLVEGILEDFKPRGKRRLGHMFRTVLRQKIQSR